MTPSRSSLAIELQDYKGPRPGIALTIAAVALIAALAVGVVHVVSLGRSGAAFSEAQQTMRTLHSYNAALQIWQQMASLPESVAPSPLQTAHRDSLATALRDHLTDLRLGLRDSTDRALAARVLDGLKRPAPGSAGIEYELSEGGRAAMIVLMARRDSALFQAAARNQRSRFLAATIIALTVIAAGVLIVPMSWLYVRYKRGIPPGM